jgi:hypothetical protein
LKRRSNAIRAAKKDEKKGLLRVLFYSIDDLLDYLAAGASVEPAATGLAALVLFLTCLAVFVAAALGASALEAVVEVVAAGVVVVAVAAGACANAVAANSEATRVAISLLMVSS